MEPFAEIIKELGDQLGLPLQPDERGACLLSINGQVKVLIEPDLNKQSLLLMSSIGELAPGKFRENVLKDGLKANAVTTQEGILAYCESKNALVLFSYLPFSSLHQKKLVDHLNLFLEKIHQWRTGIETGRTDTLVPLLKNQNEHFFGL